MRKHRTRTRRRAPGLRALAHGEREAHAPACIKVRAPQLEGGQLHELIDDSSLLGVTMRTVAVAHWATSARGLELASQHMQTQYISPTIRQTARFRDLAIDPERGPPLHVALGVGVSIVTSFSPASGDAHDLVVVATLLLHPIAWGVSAVRTAKWRLMPARRRGRRTAGLYDDSRRARSLTMTARTGLGIGLGRSDERKREESEVK